MRPMLADPVPAGFQDFPCYASLKLDGIRAVVKDGRVLTRKLELLPNQWVQRCLGRPMFEGLDGELIVGLPYAEDVFNVTQSGVMSMDGKPDFMFYVFDYWNGAAQSTPYAQRWEMLQSAFADPFYAGCLYMQLHEQRVMHKADDVALFQEDAEERGYEGLILRSPLRGYKFGRSTTNLNAAVHAKTGQPLQPWTMLKVKRFSTAEARVVGVVEMLHNENEQVENELGLAKRSKDAAGMVPAGVLGALQVTDCETGVPFNIGSGFTAEQRVSLWLERERLIGCIARYKHFEVGVKEAPRFPTFLGWRDPRDMGDPR